MKKDILIIYPSGARGDFLNSILVGNKLETSYNSLQILNGAPHDKLMMKMHSFGDSYNCSIQTMDDLKNYCTVRISIDNLNDAWLITCMAFHKHVVIEKKPTTLEIFSTDIKYQLAHLQVKNELVWRTEQQYREIDQYIDHRIPFWNLFDVGTIDNFYHQVNAERLTSEEKDRIQHNIDINLALIEQLRVIYKVDTQS